MQRFDVDRRCRCAAARCKRVRGARLQLLFPGRDLADVDTMLIRQLHNRLVAPDSGKSNLRLEVR